MANFGLSKPWIAKYDNESDKYLNAFKCGGAINTSVTPNYNEASLFSDNQQSENVTEFKNANVTLGVDSMPVEAAKVLFGHNINEENEEISKTSDTASYVGYGFITNEMKNSVKQYRACLLRKVQFKEGEEAFDTQGDSIVFKTPSLSGTAFNAKNGEWRIKSPYFDTEEKADEWIQKKLGVIPTCATPTASVKGGTYAETLNVSLETKDDAKIKYTTDGTTPNEENGTEYTKAIAISKTTVIRAIAYKSGYETSKVMNEEYIIKLT